MEAASSFPVLFHTERRGGSAQVPSNRLILLVGEGGFPRSMCPTNPVGFPLSILCTEASTVFGPRGGETRLRPTTCRLRGGETRRHQAFSITGDISGTLLFNRTTREGETCLMAPYKISGIIGSSLDINRRPRGGESRLSSTSCWCLGGETRRHLALSLIGGDIHLFCWQRGGETRHRQPYTLIAGVCVYPTTCWRRGGETRHRLA